MKRNNSKASFDYCLRRKMFALSKKKIKQITILNFISASGQYVMFLYEYLKEWRKNPQCSSSCCLALLLPLNDLQGEIRGMVGKNLMKTQLDTGMLAKPSIAATAKDSGAMSFTLCGEDVEPEKEDKRKDEAVKDSNRKRHRWTQTEVVMPPFASTVESGSMRGQQRINR